jgi:hypothetical protein
MDPLEEYTARSDRWRAAHRLLEGKFIRISNWRLAVIATAIILAWLAVSRSAALGGLLLIPLAAFVFLAVWHERVFRKQQFTARALAYYERAVARMKGSWVGTGNAGEPFRDGAHIYSEDLDVFGKGSLFELIASARTAAGERTLAGWLLAPACRDEAAARQAGVQELRDCLDLREDIALLGEDVRASVHADVLDRWGSASPAGFSSLVRWIALLLAIAGIASLLAFLAHVASLSVFIVILGLDFVFIAIHRKRIATAIEGVETPAVDLQILALLLERLEAEDFHTPKLKQIRANLEVHGLPASKRIARLKRWIEMLDSSEHLFLRVVNPVVLWKEQLAMAVEAWRVESGPFIHGWISAAGEFEALSSFASLAFERPEWAFPVLVEDANPHFEAKDLRHPLIAPAKCVPNDVALGGDTRVLIVSGSNMSGKSTLLRAIGLNAVLAWAGAPVAAASMHISSIRVGASIRVLDSLQDGRSRFYSEIVRLRQIVDLAGNSAGALFLLDEVLSGTNSHDRRIGAAAVVRALVARGAIGLVTTHDLALATLDQDNGLGIVNVHFDDEIEDGRIEFDYRLRPGVVVRSNALELMRAVGLQV